MSIYKLVHQTECYLEAYYRTISYFDYFITQGMQNPTPEHKIQHSSAYQSESTIWIDKVEELDKVILDINKIVEKGEHTNDLEQRILNVIDIFSLIDHNTPLHVGFILCMISLEGLLLSCGFFKPRQIADENK